MQKIKKKFKIQINKEHKMKLTAIRGAICCENSKESISEQTAKMCNTLFEKTCIQSKNIISMQFTLTKDLDSFNPCAALRKEKIIIDTNEIPLFCSQEAYVKNSLQKVIRVLVTCYVEDELKVSHIYLDGAEVLRPDFCA